MRRPATGAFLTAGRYSTPRSARSVASFSGFTSVLVHGVLSSDPSRHGTGSDTSAARYSTLLAPERAGEIQLGRPQRRHEAGQENGGDE
jgi:hypothetical protein